MSPTNKHRKQGKSLSQIFSKISNAKQDKKNKRIKLKAHFRDQTNKPEREEDIFRKVTDKTQIPLPPPKKNKQKKHHTIKTLKKKKIKTAHIKPSKYSKLSKGEQEALEDLQERDGTVITNVNEGVAVVITDVTGYIEKAERQ